MSLEVKKFNKNPNFDSEFQVQLVEMITALAGAITEEAKIRAPVDTGALKDSIAYTIDTIELKADIGTHGIDYARYQELGTSKMSSQPFLRPALDSVLLRL